MVNNNDITKFDIGDDFQSIFEDVFKRGKGGDEASRSRPNFSLSESMEDIHSAVGHRHTYSNSVSSEKTASPSSDTFTPRGLVLKSLVERFRNDSPKKRSNRRTPQLWWLPPTPKNERHRASSVNLESPERRCYDQERSNTSRLEHWPKRNEHSFTTSLSSYEQNSMPNITNLFPNSPSFPATDPLDMGESPSLPFISWIEDEVDVEALLATWRSQQAMGEDSIQSDNLDLFLKEEGLIASSVSTLASDNKVQEVGYKNERSRKPLVLRNNRSVKKGLDKFGSKAAATTEKLIKAVNCNKLLASERPGKGTLREERLSAERAIRAQKLNLSIGQSPKKQMRRPIKLSINQTKRSVDPIPTDESSTGDESGDESSSSSSSSLTSPPPQPTKTCNSNLVKQNPGLTLPRTEKNSSVSKIPETLRSRLAAELKKSKARTPEEIDKVLRHFLDRASEDEVREVIRLREELLEKKKKEKEVVVRKSPWTNFDEDKEIAELLKEIRLLRAEALEFFKI